METKCRSVNEEFKMNKIYLILLLNCITFSIFSNEPEIKLPQVDINIEDRKGLETEFSTISHIEFETNRESILKPEITDLIKVDLEKTLPERIDNPQKMKPVDALIKFGYGLNNNLLAYFSVFIKNFNPVISINYSRIARDNYWFEELNRKVFYSSDKLNADITYNRNLFTLNTTVGYAGSNYSLQNKSIYNTLDKKILTLDINPFIKFNSKNDLSLIIQNSFLFNNLADGQATIIDFRNDFDYLLNTNIVYSLVINNDNYLNLNTGYEFNFLNTLSNGFSSNYHEVFGNLFKTGIGYSGILKDSWTLNIDFDFQGYWKNEEFYWYILPLVKAGYNFREFFSCFIEGGSTIIDKPNKDWLIQNDYAVYPLDIIPGYDWYGKTGIKSSFAGYFTGFSELRFSYMYRGLVWNILSENEKIYTVTNADYFSLLITSGINFSYRQFVKFTIKWDHEFLQLQPFTSGDVINGRIELGIPKAGITFYTEFEGGFRRVDYNAIDLGSIYLLNAGIDWNYQERFGIGADFRNILYFQRHQIKKYYDEPGFEFTVYIKAGF